MVEVAVTIEAIGLAKLQSNRHHQQTNTQLFTGQMPFLSMVPLIFQGCMEKRQCKWNVYTGKTD